MSIKLKKTTIPWPRKFIITIFLLIVLGVILHALLPRFILRYVNKVLNQLPDYTGHVEDIDIALLRGAYVIKGFDLKKKSGTVTEPFVSIPISDLSIEWRAIFQGKFVGEIEVSSPQMNIVNASSPTDSQIATQGDWQGMIADLMPVRINRFAITDGKISYRHEGTKSPRSVEISSLQATLSNLTNHPVKGDPLPSQILLNGTLQGYAPVRLTGRIDPLGKSPTFDLDTQINKIPLDKFDELLMSTIGIDAESGTFELYGEATCRNGTFSGYVKPILKEVKIVSIQKDSDNPLRLLWESIVSLVVEVFTNQRHDQFAAKIPIEGRIDDPEAGIFTALRSIVSNAYVKALKATIDDNIEFTEKADTER